MKQNKNSQIYTRYYNVLRVRLDNYYDEVFSSLNFLYVYNVTACSMLQTATVAKAFIFSFHLRSYFPFDYVL